MSEQRLCRLRTRREVLQSGCGVGALALSSLLRSGLSGSEAAASEATNSQSTRGARTHFAPRAKSVIHIHLVGAPSHLDLFVNKPELRRRDGQLVPREFIEGQRFAFLRGHPKLMGSRFEFNTHGESGTELSELLPHLGGVVDDLAVLRTVHTEEFNHAPAQLFAQTGFAQFGRPSFGAWVAYGLGTENQDLPAFVVLRTGATAGAGNSLWGSGFLSSQHQGIEFRNRGEPVLFLDNPTSVGRQDRRRMLDTVQLLNQLQLADVGDPQIATRIAQYEKAFRMQISVPELADIRSEPAAMHELYGTAPGKASFANNCLLARRLVERGVRFVQLYDSGWDHHSNLEGGLRAKARSVDRPVAALLTDLKQRGLLDETLVIWGAEFGRTPMQQGDAGKKVGRDHHKDAFVSWMAGAGVRGGTTYGDSDELGYRVAHDPVHINDLHATYLHLLGVDHEFLTFRFQGRDYRLTDVGGRVIHDVLA